MDINSIMPYEKNARHNARAVPVVADSIREFGLRGQIVLESRENPVIVAGHTRWAACKSLGWTEIPDEKIDFCDGLTPEQVKAFRLADNRTGEVATWNIALLKQEIGSLEGSSIDMSRFQFDFKSKLKPYGAERLRTDSSYNLGLVNAYDCDERGMPTIEPCDVVPSRLMAFNYAKSATEFDCGLHFFIDDYQFERIWQRPGNYVELLRKFECVLSPDFSLYLDMPLPMQQWNEYRRRALAHYWQANGIPVIPTLSWSDERSYAFCFGGLPKGAIYAVSTVGVMSDEFAAETWRRGMLAAIEELRPRRLILYGASIDFDYGDIECVQYTANTAFRK